MIRECLLSICVPTFLGAAYLRELLSNLALQDRIDDVEIVISDNASPDNTTETVSAFRNSFKRLLYLRNEHNLGFRENLISSVRQASGEYIWLFGDDDAPRPGAIAYALALIDALHPDVINSQRISCDALLRPYFRGPKIVIEGRSNPPASEDSLQLHKFSEDQLLLNYLRGNTSPGHLGLLVFISTLIFRRSAWSHRYFNYPSLAFEVYPHVIKLFESLLIRGGTLVTTGAALVLARNWALRPAPDGSPQSRYAQSEMARSVFDSFAHYHRDLKCFVDIANYFFPGEEDCRMAFLTSSRSLLEIGNNFDQYVNIASHRGVRDEALNLGRFIFANRN